MTDYNPLLVLDGYPELQLELDRTLADTVADAWAAEHEAGNAEASAILSGLMYDLLLGRYDS